VTVGEALVAGRERLQASGDEGRFDALRLLEEVLGRNAAWIVAHGDDVLVPAAAQRYEAALARRARGEPVAYICGAAGFFGRTFAVGPDVLVPRPESEHVVQLALEALDALDAARICDLGTGSGVLAITLALERPAARVTALDVSPAALAVAAANARALGVASRVRFVPSNAFDALAASERFDCIVANLPYVRSADLKTAPDPTAFEPRLALDGGADGLDAYRYALGGAALHLAAPGAAFFEAGPDTAEALADLAAASFPEASVTVHRDYGGRRRVVEVRRGSPAPTEKADNP
jgi:release factor glutamine methyltransferase